MTPYMVPPSSNHGADSAPLAWCAPAIREALGECEHRLEAWRTHDGDRTAALRTARNRLHQADGALRMLDFVALARVTSAGEAAIDQLGTELPGDQGEKIAVTLAEMLSALASHVDRAASGAPADALPLFPYYARLQTVCGKKCHPCELYEPPAANEDVIDDPLLTVPRDAQLRQEFERGLVGYLRGEPDALLAMRSALLPLAERADIRSFWRIAMGVLDALRLGAIPQSVDLKPGLARVSAALRGALTDDASRLNAVRDLLFLLSHAAPPPAELQPLFDAFSLSPLAVEHYSGFRYARQDARRLTSTRESLAQAKLSWESIVRGAWSDLRGFASDCARLAQALKALDEPFLARLAQATAQCAQALANAQRAPSDATTVDVACALLAIEGALDAPHARPADLQQRIETLVQRLIGRKPGDTAEASSETPAWLEQLAREAHHRLTLAAFVAECQSNLRQVETTLDSFFKDGSRRSDLPAALRLLDQLAGALRLLERHDAVAAIEAGRVQIEAFCDPSFEPPKSEFERIAANFGALGFLIGALADRDSPLAGSFRFDRASGLLVADMVQRRSASTDQSAPKTVPAAAQLPAAEPVTLTAVAPATPERVEPVMAKAVVEPTPSPAHVSASAQPQASPSHVVQRVVQVPQRSESVEPLAQAVAKAVAQATPASTPTVGADPFAALSANRARLPSAAELAAAAKPQTPVAPPASHSGAGSSELDPDLVEIFLAEAQELIETSAETLALLRAEPANPLFLSTLRRVFHTLKGSSRMVGLTAFGEAAWSMEKALNWWLAQERPANDALLQLIETASDDIAGWIDALNENINATIEPALIIDEAEQVLASAQHESPVANLMPLREPEPLLPIAVDETTPAITLEGVDPPESLLPPPVLRTAVVELDPSVPSSEMVASKPIEASDLALDWEGPWGAAVDNRPADGGVRSESMLQAEVLATSAAVDDLILDDLDFDDLLDSDLPLSANELAAAHGQPAQDEPQSDLVIDGISFEPAVSDGLVLTLEPGAAELIPDAPAPSQSMPSALPALSDFPSADFGKALDGLTAADLDLGAPSLAMPPIDSHHDDDGDADLAGLSLNITFDEMPQPESAADAAPPESLAIDLSAEDAAHDDGLGTMQTAGGIDETPPIDFGDDALDLVWDDAVVDPVDVEPATAGSRLPTVNGLVKIGPIEVSAPLCEIFLGEADELIRQLVDDVIDWREQPQRLATPTAVRLAHSLAGSSGVIGLKSVRAVAQGLERLFDAQIKAAEPLPESALLLIVDAVAQLQTMLHQFAGGAYPDDDFVTLDELRALAEPLEATATARAAHPEASMESPASMAVVIEPPAIDEPVAAEPVAVEPVAVEPAAAEPVAVEPAAAEPAAAEPAAAEPVAVEPVAVEQSAVEPVIAKSDGRPGAAFEPVAPKLVEVDPVPVDPFAIKPVVPRSASFAITNTAPKYAGGYHIGPVPAMRLTAARPVARRSSLFAPTPVPEQAKPAVVAPDPVTELPALEAATPTPEAVAATVMAAAADTRAGTEDPADPVAAEDLVALLSPLDSNEPAADQPAEVLPVEVQPLDTDVTAEAIFAHEQQAVGPDAPTQLEASAPQTSLEAELELALAGIVLQPQGEVEPATELRSELDDLPTAVVVEPIADTPDDLLIPVLEELLEPVDPEVFAQPLPAPVAATDELLPLVLDTKAFAASIEPPRETPKPATAELADLGDSSIHDDMPAEQDQPDSELMPIFIDEGDELMPEIGNKLRRWRGNLTEFEHPQGLMRILHTAKGSARMAGCWALGAMLHDMEARVETLVTSGQVAIPEIDKLLQQYDKVVARFDRLAGRGLVESAAPAVAAPAATAAPVSAAGSVPAFPAAPVPAMSPAPVAQPTPVVRVRADVLDRMVSQSGEVSIARARLEDQLESIRHALSELSENVGRLRSQLREIEIQAESSMQSRLAESDSHVLDPLEFDRYTRSQELTRMLAESVDDVATVQQNLIASAAEASKDLSRQAQATRDLHQELMRVRMVQFGPFADRFYRVVRQAAQQLGKRASLNLIGATVEVDRGVLERMAGPIEHLLRNAVVHGLESPEERERVGKPPVGRVTLEVRQDGNEIVLILSDDGRGLNADKLRARAIERGLFHASAHIPDHSAYELIFAPGFSTAEQVTELAGRGVGMDVVRSEAAALGGRVEVDSTAGQGARFTVHLPLSLVVTQVVLAKIGSATYAIPAVLVEQMLQLKPSALEAAYASGRVESASGAVGLSYLGALLEDLTVAPPLERVCPVLVVAAGGERVAVHVDSLVPNKEVVVKSVGPQLARIAGITGATVLGNGQIVLILNPVQLAMRQRARSGAAVPMGVAPVRVRTMAQAPTIMVVDDSLTVRKVTQRLLLRAGYEVVLAKDGVDALRLVSERIPDMMLVDIEMPRMDGFDLVRHLRADAATFGIPVIMITSRTADKHRNIAESLGVDEYMGKPFNDDELLTHIRHFVAHGRGAGAGPAQDSMMHH